MSLLSVTVKKARYASIHGEATQFNTYATLKLQNVKSTTVTVKGPNPSWEQDFLFEINDINLGLVVEVWNKGVIWDRALGYHYLPLTTVAYEEQEVGGRWVELEAQTIVRGGAVVGTAVPTGHALLLDCRFELPFDAEGTGGADLQRKLDLLNGALDAEQRAEQARRQMQYIAHSGYSEDSDYTSDLNYPVGQHANCSASQFRTAAHQMHTPQRSLEVSRENLYERDEYHIHSDADPLYYNSQPRKNRIDTWSQMHAQASVESAISWRTATDWQSQEEQRRPSLERQSTLYDDNIGYGYDTFSTTHIMDPHITQLQQASYEEYYDSTSNPYEPSYIHESDPYDPDRPYYFDDCGLTPTEYENIMNKRRSSVVQLPQIPAKQHGPSSRFSECNDMAPYRPRRRTTASLPATPSSTPKRGRGRTLPVPPGSETGSVRSGRRRLPPTPATHVPYLPEPKQTIPDTSYGYDSFGYQTTATEQYDANYNTSTYDEDGMQPFFDETPHATPPAAAQKPWSDTDNQFQYAVTSATSVISSKVVSSTISLPQPPVTQQNNYQDYSYSDNYQEYDTSYNQFDNQQYQQYDETDQGYQETDRKYSQIDQTYHEQCQDQKEYTHSYDYKYQDNQQQFNQQNQQQKQFNQSQNQYNQTQQLNQQFNQQQQLNQSQNQQQQQFNQSQNQYNQTQQPHQSHQQTFNQQEPQPQLTQQQINQQKQQLYMQQQEQQYLQQQQQKQQVPPTQLQATVLTGAATLGSLVGFGAKKLGNLFGAAAAAVAPPIPATTAQSQSHFPTTVQPVAPVTPFTSASVSIASVPQTSSAVPLTVNTSTPTNLPSLPRAPSLKRQESIQRPPVRRTRTLPEVPDDQMSYDESAYEDDYHKTEIDSERRTSLDRVSLDRYRDEEYPHDRASLDRYHDDEFHHETIPEDVSADHFEEESILSPIQKTASPMRVIAPMAPTRKPSVDSYHSQAPSLVERKPSQSSFHLEPEAVAVPTTLEETTADKQKVTFQIERPKYHEVREDSEEQYDDDQANEYQEDQEAFRDNDNEDQTEEEFRESNSERETLDFQPEQPKLTAKQRWHRAYNKVVMQLNVSHFSY